MYIKRMLPTDFVSKPHLIQQLSELTKELSPKSHKLTDADITLVLNQKQTVIFAYRDDDRIYGMAALTVIETFGKKYGHVDSVVVHPAMQGKCIGRQLMKHITQYAKDEELEHIDLTCKPGREAANRLYSSLKFRKRETNAYRLQIRGASKS